MAAPRNRRHILVNAQPLAEGFTSPRTGRGRDFPRPPDRARHAQRLLDGLNLAIAEGHEQPVAPAEGTQPRGILLTFQAPPGVELNLKSLENKTGGIEIRAAHRARPAGDGPFIESATVFIPEGQTGHFLRRFQEYASEDTKGGQPRHRELVERIADVHLATLRELWTDGGTEFPADDAVVWWEVWLRGDDGTPGAELVRLQEIATSGGFALGVRHLVFDDRTVCLVRATAAQLASSADLFDDLAELRTAKVAAAFFVDLNAAEQAAWAGDLLARLI